MAALVTNGTGGSTGTHPAVGATEIIASGNFDGATVDIELDADALNSALVYQFTNQGAIVLQTAAGTNITATVRGGGADTLVDVSANP